MWAVFCSLNAAGLPPTFVQLLRFGPFTLAREDPEERAPEPAPHAPCACCYYNMLDDFDYPDFGTSSGWFYHYQQERWIWWHGQAPHAPFEFRQQHQNLPEAAILPEGQDENLNPGDDQDEDPGEDLREDQREDQGLLLEIDHDATRRLNMVLQRRPSAGSIDFASRGSSPPSLSEVQE